NPEWNGLCPDPGSSFAPYRIYNIGSNKPVQLLEFIKIIEDLLGLEAKKEFLPMQPGDVHETYADIRDITKNFGFSPGVSIREGLASFIKWYKEYQQKKSRHG